MVRAGNRSLERLNLLIEDLLTLSKAESSYTDLERIDLAPVLEEAVTDVRLTAARRGITVALERAGRGQALVLGDRIMLYRAFLNVLSNAVKFSPADATVEARLGLDGDEVVVEIIDHGIGIPVAEQGLLGTRFFRASNAVDSAIAGTGLGIRIVQTVVDRHAGAMRLDSEEGQGTTITLRFPRQHEPTDPSIEPPQARAEGIPERQPALD
jgi:two-component system, OmpR family, sensor kinase